MNKERAALVHGYLTDREGKDRPDRLTRVGILAAVELYRHREIDKVCFTAEEKLSNNQIKRLRILLDNPPEEDVVIYPESVTTEDEIKTFKKMSEDNDWENLLTIGNEAHLTRIRREIRRIFRDKVVETTTPRQVLAKYPRYSPILEEMDSWPEQRSLVLQEKLLNTPIIGTLALRIVPLVSKYKVALQSWAFNQVEK